MYRFRDRAKFYLERWIQRGAAMQLLFIAGVIVSIAVTGGLIAWIFSPQFDHPGGAIWWAFLRLTDPGYLGDDEGALLRTLSTVITVLGYVLFLGSLVAILTQWLNATMRKLESGLTPITMRDHVLILGWTNRTATIVQELMLSEARVRRFLRRRGARTLRIVVLSDVVNRERMVELRETLGSRWREHRVILRSGTSLRIEHLRRVAYRTASVVIIPGADFLLGGAQATDARVIKTLISLSPHHQREQRTGPSLVAEIFDPRNTPVAENAYVGGHIDVVSSDSFVSRLIAQNIRHRGLSYVYAELLSHRAGNEVYVRHIPECTGRTFGECVGRTDRAIVLGIVRPDGNRYVPCLNPPADRVLDNKDALVYIARSYEDCEPAAGPPTAEMKGAASPAPRETPGPIERRILMLGWSHKVIALIDEFADYRAERFHIDVLSRVAATEREAAMRGTTTADRLTVRQLHGDYTIRDTLVSVQPSAYDNVAFLASDWLDSEEESDARTILGYVLLRSILEQAEHRPEVLIELMDPENARLFKHRTGEVIISPMILSHILAHVALRPELNAVFNELFGAGGAEFSFRSASELGLAGQSLGIGELQRAASTGNHIALGLRIRSEFERTGGGVYLNPPPDRRWTLQPDDEVVLLTEG